MVFCNLYYSLRKGDCHLFLLLMVVVITSAVYYVIPDDHHHTDNTITLMLLILIFTHPPSYPKSTMKYNVDVTLNNQYI